MSAYELFKIEIYQVEEQVAQGSGGITVPGGVLEKVGRGVQGHGLVVTLVIGGWFDQMR